MLLVSCHALYDATGMSVEKNSESDERPVEVRE